MMEECQASKLASLPYAEGRKKLLEYLELDLDFGYDEELRSNIHTDLLYDTFTHAVIKGFSWRDVCKSVQLTQHLLETLMGKSVVEATAIFQQTALTSGMDNRSLAIFTEHFFSTFMQHYRLYQLVFQSAREQKTFTDVVVVRPPIPPEELRYAKVPLLHEYDQKLKEIHTSRKEVKEIQPLGSVAVELDDEVAKCPQAEALEKIISQVMQNVGQPIANEITDAITMSYEDLNMKLDETALPRPKQLGAPPRYQLKPAIAAPKAAPATLKPPAHKHSGKGERKTSGKAR